MGKSSALLLGVALATACTPKSSEKGIGSFVFEAAKNAGLTADVTATVSGTDIAATVPFGTAVTALVPTIKIAGMSVTPASGAAQDFTNPVTYTVMADDMSTKAFKVAVTVAPSNAKDITKFTILNIDGTITGTDIAVTVPFGSDKTKLTPTIVITGASVSPASGVEQNFTNPVTYTVTAADGSTKAYTATVTVAPSSAKDITVFKFLVADNSALTADVTGTISGTGIVATVAYGTNRTALKPTIEITGASVSPTSGTAKDFTNPVTYTVTAADGSTKAYTVTVNQTAASTAKDITSFQFTTNDNPALTAHITATITGTDIAATVPFGTAVTALKAAVVISDLATVSPQSGAATDFTNPVTFTVTAQDSSTKAYTATVTIAPAPSAACDITKFTINGVDGEIGTDNAIAVTLPHTTDSVTDLVPTIEISAAATVAPASGVAQDFTSARTYVVTAEDGTTTKTYTASVTVLPPPSTAAFITSFKFLAADNAGALASDSEGAVDAATDGSTDIAVTVPYGTNISALKATIAVSAGATVSPASGAEQNFGAPVPYTVTAEDTTTTRTYLVTVTVTPASTEAKILSFKVGTRVGVITHPDGSTDGTIAVALAHTADLAHVTPEVEVSAGATVSPDGSTDVDFSAGAVAFTVTAEDGTTTGIYQVTSTLLSGAADITAFSIDGVNGEIGTDNGIALTLPFGTDLEHLSPTIAVSAGATVDPASGAQQDFTSAVTYTVTADDGTTKEYVVTVTEAEPSHTANITEFKFLETDNASMLSADATATLDGTTDIAIELPFETAVDGLTDLKPTIAVSALATIDPPSKDGQDFSNGTAVLYTVTAQDGTTQKIYRVTVSIAPSDEKEILSFSIDGSPGTFGGDGNTDIAVVMPYGTDSVTDLAPTITLSEDATVSPADGQTEDFTNPVEYIVTAADGSTKVYRVTVTVALNPAKAITGFGFLVSDNAGLSEDVEGVVDEDNHAIAVTVPSGTDVTALVPAIVHTGDSIDPDDGVAQNFTNPVVYEVTAADGSAQNYTVTVTVAQ